MLVSYSSFTPYFPLASQISYRFFRRNVDGQRPASHWTRTETNGEHLDLNLLLSSPSRRFAIPSPTLLLQKGSRQIAFGTQKEHIRPYSRRMLSRAVCNLKLSYSSPPLTIAVLPVFSCNHHKSPRQGTRTSGLPAHGLILQILSHTTRLLQLSSKIG